MADRLILLDDAGTLYQPKKPPKPRVGEINDPAQHSRRKRRLGIDPELGIEQHEHAFSDTQPVQRHRQHAQQGHHRRDKRDLDQLHLGASRTENGVLGEDDRAVKANREADRAALAGERHKGLFGAVKAPRPPSFNEVDVSDKPSWIRGKARFSSSTLSNIDSRYRNQVRTLAAVDEAIEAIVGQLNASGRLQDTYIIFLQDNGWQAGEHRVAGTKGLPYEESLRASLYVRGPGVAASLKIDRLAVNADLAPTILDLAGAEPLPRADGRSLVELLRGQTPTTWRNAIPIAFREQSWSWWPSWRGVRTSRYTYVEYEGGERELYDNAADPYQLRSLHGSAAMEPLRSQLASLAGRLNACAGAECRAIEAEDVP